MSAISLRPARLSDAAQIGAVGYAAWLKGIGGHVGPEAHCRIDAETFEAFARTSWAQILVAECDGAVVGFAGTEAGDNYISDLWVSPDFEGRGIGARLVAALERVIAERGYDSAEIEVLTANGRALQLYQRLGYRIVWQGRREDAVLCVELHKTLLSKGVGAKT